MGKKRISLGDQIRQAVKDAPTSRNAICRAAGIDPAALSRFVSGKLGLMLPALNALSAVLGLRIVVDPSVAVPSAGKAGRPRKTANTAGKTKAPRRRAR